MVEVRDAAQPARMPRAVPTGEVSGRMTAVVAQSSPVPDLQARPSECELGASCWMRVPGAPPVLARGGHQQLADVGRQFSADSGLKPFQM